MRWLIILAFFASFLAYVGFYINKSWQPFKDVRLFREDTCVYISTPEGQIEDLTFTSEGLGIGSIDDKVTLNGKGPQHTKQGGFVLVTLEPFKYEFIEIEGFPSDIALHPHGIFLHEERWLYAINYAYEKGGQRVEVFELVKSPKLSLRYNKSILFGDEYLGRLNDLVVLRSGELYVSSWLPRPHKITGNHFTDATLMLLTFEWTFLNPTELLRCDVNQSFANCKVQLKGQQINGVTTDGTDVFVNDFFGRVIIRMSRLPNGNLTEQERIEIDFSLDNVEFDKVTGNIYGGGLATIARLLNYVIFGASLNPGAIAEIKKVDGLWKAETIAVIDELRTVSSASRWDKYVFIGTWQDTKVGRCKLWK